MARNQNQQKTQQIIQVNERGHLGMFRVLSEKVTGKQHYTHDDSNRINVKSAAYFGSVYGSS
jgi:rubrerythrin